MEATVRRILVAIDFSGPSFEALKFAQGYAHHFKASLVLIHAMYLTDQLFGAGTFALSDTIDHIQNSASSELKKLCDGVKADGLACETIVVQGAPDEEIRNYAANAAHQIDLIVVGTHGRTGLSRVAFGSVAQRILQAAPCPALVVPARRSPDT